MNNYNAFHSVDKSFNAFHKRIFLYFISAEQEFLSSPNSFPNYIETMVNELNSLGFHRSKSQWLELMQTWIISVSTSSDSSQVSSTEDINLQQNIAENQLWSNPSNDQISCVAQYLESNSKASNLWKMMSFELNQMGNVKEDEKFWMEVFHRYARRLNARKDLIDYLTTKYKNSPFPALTKLESRILKLIPIEQATSKSSTQRNRSMKKTQLTNLSTHCRVCLTGASSKMIYLFDESAETQKVDSISVLNMLNFCGCFSNEARLDDGLPDYICVDCSALIESAYKLRTLCSKTEDKFSDVLYSKKVSNKIETKPTTSDAVIDYGLNIFDENVEIDNENNVENIEIKCDCGDVFFDNTIFIEHLKTHGDDFVPKEKFPCPECNKIYRGKHSLNIHMRTHSGERPYVCQICGKTFKTPSSRNKHTVVHSIERNHKCLLCPFVTNTQANLRVHERSHSGIKPYECRLCSLKFTTASNMAKHIRNIHEKEKPHKCEQCGRAFFSRESLRMHSVTHLNGLKPFICPKKDCLAAFGWYRKLKKHVFKDHANENIRIPTEKSYFEQLQMHLD